MSVRRWSDSVARSRRRSGLRHFDRTDHQAAAHHVHRVGGVGAAGLAVISEKPELRSQALVFTALGEAVAIYGIVMAIIILGQT